MLRSKERTLDRLLEHVLCFVEDEREVWGINGKIFVWTDFESESGLGSGDMSIEGRLIIESLGEGFKDIDDWKDIISLGVLFAGIFTRRKFNNLLKFLFFLAGLLLNLVILVGQMRSRRSLAGTSTHVLAGD